MSALINYCLGLVYGGTNAESDERGKDWLCATPNFGVHRYTEVSAE